MSILNTLRQIHGDWTALQSFTAFTFPGAGVQATLRGLRINLDVSNNSDFVGVGRFDPHPQTRSADLVGPATYEQASAYLSSFPRSAAVLFRNKHNNWIGVSNRQISPVYAVSDYFQEFESARIFKIGDVWVFGSQSVEYPRVSSSLRLSFENKDRVLMIRGATPDHRIAYTEKLNLVERPKTTLPDAVSFMGGKLIDMVNRGDGTSLVTYTVHSTTFTSLVDSATMRVVSAGICLDGEDSNFDLTTLIPVIRKGIETNRIHRTGINNEYSNDD